MKRTYKRRVMLHLFYVYLLMRRVFPLQKFFQCFNIENPADDCKINWIKPLSPHWKWRWRNNKKYYANYVTGISKMDEGEIFSYHTKQHWSGFQQNFVDIVARCVSSKFVDVIRWVGFLLIFVYLYSQRVGLYAFIYENVLWKRRKW